MDPLHLILRTKQKASVAWHETWRMNSVLIQPHNLDTNSKAIGQQIPESLAARKLTQKKTLTTGNKNSKNKIQFEIIIWISGF